MYYTNFQAPQTTERIVYVDFEYTRLGEIDTMNEKFYADVLIQATWIENGIIQKYDKEKNWNPEITIENMFTKPDENIEYQTLVKGGFTQITEKRRVKGHFWERLEIHDFPHDVQELSVVLTSKLDSRKIKLVPRNYKLGVSTIHTFVEQQKWRLLNLVETTTEVSYEEQDELESIMNTSLGEEYKKYLNRPKLVFKTFACRKPFYFYINAYSLIFLITCSAIGIFSMDPKLPQARLQTTATILLTSVSFKWVVNRSLPAVSYTTTLDEYSTLCIFFLCLLMAWHAIVGAHWTKSFALEIDKWLLLGFSCLFIALHVYLIMRSIISYWKVFKLERRMKDYVARLENLKKQEKRHVV